MKRRFLFSVALAFVASGVSFSQTTGGRAAPDEAELVTRIYRVTDLVLETRNYAFNGIDLPGLGPQVGTGFLGGPGGISGGMGGFSGGGLGGFGGGGGMGGVGQGGGFFAVGDDVRIAQADGNQEPGGGEVRNRGMGLRLTLHDLMHVLTTTIQPQTWSDLGGAGTITSVAGMLVVLQTPRVHEQIATLLDDLRKQGAAINSLTVRAYWVVSNDVGSLLVDHRRVNRSQLAEQMKTGGAVGQISCFDSQTVHLVMGNIRSVVTSVTPVVGQSEKRDCRLYAGTAHDQGGHPEETMIPNDVLGQLAESEGGGEGGSGFTADGGGSLQSYVAGSSRAGGVGYQPVTRTNIFGGLLQVTPSLDPSGRSAILDVQSIVIRPNAEQQAPIEFNNVTKLERINLVMQQFKTTLRLPINQPVLVAGSTLQPLQNKEAPEQLYLIMEVLTDEVPPATQRLQR